MHIIIPAFRAAHTLPRCLGALLVARASLGEEARITVVDDGENGDIASLAASHGVELVQMGPSGSAAVARNRGAARARSGIIVFVDADVEVAPDGLRRLVAPLRDGRADAAIGNYSEDTTGLSFVQSYKQLYVSHVYARRPGLLQNQFWSALCAIRAEVLHEVGGFAPSFEGACDEDTELGFRLTRAGKRVAAVPDAKGRNLKPYTLRTLVLNDLHKGTSTIQVALHNRVPVSDNRHASRVDILAVCLSCATLAAPLASAVAGLRPWAAAISLLLLGSLHLVARQALFRALRHHRGARFAVRAVGLVFLLDLVRAVCVVRALAALGYDAARRLGSPSPPDPMIHPTPKEGRSC